MRQSIDLVSPDLVGYHYRCIRLGRSCSVLYVRPLIFSSDAAFVFPSHGNALLACEGIRARGKNRRLEAMAAPAHGRLELSEQEPPSWTCRFTPGARETGGWLKSRRRWLESESICRNGGFFFPVVVKVFRIRGCPVGFKCLRGKHSALALSFGCQEVWTETSEKCTLDGDKYSCRYF